ncbi:MAG: CHAT domain-containing protein [Planctomycetota bacterium]
MRANIAVLLSLTSAFAQGEAQDDELKQALLRAFRAVEDPRAQGFADLDAVFVELDRLRLAAGSLPKGRSERTRFFVAQRQAEVRLRQGRLDDAAKLGLAARTQALADGVFSGGYRAQNLVLLEQCVDAATFRELLRDERAFLTSDDAEKEAPWLGLPLAMLRAQIAFADGDDARGLGLLESCADRALRELPREDSWRVKAVGRLAWEFIVRRDLERAEVYLKELPPQIAAYPRGLIALRRGDADFALRAGQSVERNGQVVRGLMLQGEAHELGRRFEEARDCWTRLLEVAKEPLDRAVALRSLGECVQALDPGEGAARQAEARYREALELLRGDRHAVIERVQVHALLGDALAAQGRRDEARAAYRESLHELDAARAGLAVDLFGGSWLASAHLRCIEGLLALWDAQAGDAADALAILEFGKARTLLDWAVEPPKAGDAARITAAIRGVALGADASALDAQLRALEDARRESADGSRANAVPLDATALRSMARAEPGALFLSYWIGARAAYVVALSGHGGECIALGPAGEVRAAFARAHDAMLGDDDPWPALDAAAQRLLPPAIAMRCKNAARVVFCPDDELAQLPFEALRVDGRPLGIVRAVERAPSLSLRSRLASRAPEGAGVAIIHSIATPADAARLHLDPLTFSAREAGLVAGVHSGVIELSGAAASLEGLRALLSAHRFDVVHVSAHAIVDRMVPTASLLVCADGPVALPSLCSIGLHGALLVLSACSTAEGGAGQGGEGGLGLLGWPVAAGARGVVASLWPVNQQATSDLMGQFHAFLVAGDHAAEAMRRAREVLAASPNYAHPRYWAGFAVFGDGVAEETADVRPLWFGGGGVVVLIVAVARRRRRNRSPAENG